MEENEWVMKLVSDGDGDEVQADKLVDLRSNQSLVSK